MSIIFGIRQDAGCIVEHAKLCALAKGTERYADTQIDVVVSANVGMAYQPYHTHDRMSLERQPAYDLRGDLLTFDGRLDNHKELSVQLDLCDQIVPDSRIVLAAFSRWGEHCFSKFVGDWALALWSQQEKALYLARDHAGTRTLYYRNEAGTLQWSTYLETFFVNDTSPPLDQGYLACYLCSRPINDLTPYEGIVAVPPAHYFVATGKKSTIRSHWEPAREREINYRTSQQYEDHFLNLFRQSVDRRSGPGSPILAQLSGGMDSTAIVCMSDSIRRAQGANTSELLDTLSFYNDLEPDWNERRYFSVTEARRGKTGVHIDIATDGPTYEPLNPDEGAFLWPGADSGTIQQERETSRLAGPEYRVILNGIGGDELLGGVPYPIPELAAHLLSGNLPRLLSQTFRWCMVKRTPMLDMLVDTIRTTASLYYRPSLEFAEIPPWIHPTLRGGCEEIERQRIAQRRSIGRSPVAIVNSLAWSSIVESLPHLNPAFTVRNEYRYPYLDRDLVDFLFRIPREQLLRPGRRRALMRSALKTIVPPEILERRRKAFLIRTLLLSVRNSADKIRAVFEKPLVAEYGFVDHRSFLVNLDAILDSSRLGMQRSMLTTVALELWLQSRVRDERQRRRAPKLNEIALAATERKGSVKVQPAFDCL
jgi:asparagine synthase (glutamine-hydrolysing)